MVSLLIVVIYLAFIGLGLPDSLLGSAWPTMNLEFNVSISYAGIVSMVIALGTIISSLFSSRLTSKFGSGLITAFSTLLTAISIWGFSISTEFYMLILWSIPFGLGAGAVDATLNNFVAIHYKSRHMSWLHAMWGLGATISPLIMGAILTNGLNWNLGYKTVSKCQIVLAIIIFLSLPLWKKLVSKDNKTSEKEKIKCLSAKEIFSLKGSLSIFIAFFCYCAFEQTTMLWASSYMKLHNGIDESISATFGSMFIIGLTISRILNGFLTFKFNDKELVRIGSVIIMLGCVAMLLPFGIVCTIVGLILIGLGCGPIYPCIIHLTPRFFGEENSQSIIGLQMAFAYVGICLMPPFFGFLASLINISILPIFVMLFLVLMCVTFEMTLAKTKAFSKNK